MNEAIHLVALLGSALVAGFTFARARARYGSKRWALLALGTYATAAVFSQITLLHAPTTVRTWASIAAALVGLVYVAVTARATKE